MPPHLPDAPPVTPSVSWYRIGFWAALFIIVVVAGVAAGWVAHTRLAPDVTVIERPTPVFVPQDAASVVNAIDKKVLRGVLPVYRLPSVSPKPGANTPAIIDARDLLGYAVALTNDGWIVTTKEIARTIDARVYTGPAQFLRMEKVVLDPVTALAFVKLSSASLDAVPLARIDGSVRTDVAAVATTQGPLRAIIIDAVSYSACGAPSCIVQDAARYEDLGLASPLYNGVQPGHPIFNRRGEVLGIITALDRERMGVRFVPASTVNSVLPTLFSKGIVSRPQLPITYVELSRVRSLDPVFDRTGAAVISVTAPSKKNPTPAFPLRKDDIITAVNGVAVDASNSFSSLLMSHPVGTTVQMQITRAGRDMVVDVPLLAP